MKNSGCPMQIVTFVVTVIVVNLMWTAWGWLSGVLAASGASPALLLIGTLLFAVFVFGAITKLGILIGMPRTIRFIPASVEEVAGATAQQLQTRAPLPDPGQASRAVLPLDAGTLEDFSRQMEELGFERVMDFLSLIHI